jgi:hypothetical protein
MKYSVLILAALFVGCAKPPEPAAEIVVKVAVLNFDPAVGDSSLHAHFGWNSPRELAEEYVSSMREISHNQVTLDIVSWSDENVFPVKNDGFEYSLEAFQSCWLDRSTCHDPDGSDYLRLIEQYNIVEGIDSGAFDELWIFGAPYMGFWESSMAGPGAFYINGGVFEEVESTRPFAIMGFSYERGVAEMIHNMCHRTEATMEKISGGWDTTDLSTDWARYAANAHQSNGVSALGSCHYPPNGTSDYDYDNLDFVLSNAEGWMTYPDVGVALDSVNADTWGGPLYHLNYMKWWFSHLPHVSGKTPSGMESNWWKYIYEFDSLVVQDPIATP